MAKRKRSSSRSRAADSRAAASAGSEPSGAEPVDPDVARFAAWVREQQEAERADKQAAREARQRRDEGTQLLAAKDAAAAALKAARARERTSPEELTAADAAYRDALAALITAETGTAPRWAPAAEAAQGPGEPPETTGEPR